MTTPAQYQDLGSRGPILGISDVTQNVNPYLPGTGWDVVIDPNQWFSNLTDIEIYHIALDGPIGSSVTILRNGHTWDFVAQGWANGWDPSQPLPIPQQDLIQICWNTAFTSGPYNKTSNVQPTVTIWARKLITPNTVF